MIKLASLLESMKLKQWLYHATYKNMLPSIKKYGLDPSKITKQAWPDCPKDRIYFSDDPHVAMSYAESSDDVPANWLDHIVLLKVDRNKLDASKIFTDTNNQNGDTLEYRGTIGPDLIYIVKQ